MQRSNTNASKNPAPVRGRRVVRTSGESAKIVSTRKPTTPAVAVGKLRKASGRSSADARVQVETGEVIAIIGARLRALRIEKGLTLHALAAETGLSSSMLSLLERGKTGPSIGTLVALASALGTRMSELLGARDGADEPVCRVANQRVYATADGVRRRILKSDPIRGVEIAINEYSADTASASQPTTHEGYEFGIALEGNLEITLNGQVHAIAAGDLVSYRSSVPHRIANPGKRTARALWVNLRQG